MMTAGLLSQPIPVLFAEEVLVTLHTAPMPLQYIMSESGQRVGVLLSWQDFQQLQLRSPDDPDVLHGLSVAELQALADGMLSPEHQEELSILLQKNDNGVLSAGDAKELDRLLEQIDSLSILKARARLTLQRITSISANFAPQ